MYTYDCVSTEKIRRQHTPFVYYYDEIQWVQYIWKELITVEWAYKIRWHCRAQTFANQIVYIDRPGPILVAYVCGM